MLAHMCNKTTSLYRPYQVHSYGDTDTPPHFWSLCNGFVCVLHDLVGCSAHSHVGPRPGHIDICKFIKKVNAIHRSFFVPTYVQVCLINTEALKHGIFSRRPLPVEMLRCAREDTHYLLYK